MFNTVIAREHVEKHILGSILNGHVCPPLDEMEFMDLQIDYKIFTTSYTIKMIAKAIYNMKNENLPIDDLLVLEYIQNKTDKLNQHEYYDIVCSGTGSYLSVCNYIKLLEKIDKEQRLWERI